MMISWTIGHYVIEMIHLFYDCLLACQFPLQKKTAAPIRSGFLSCCRGRDRTSRRQLAITQSSVVDPGRLLLSGSMLRLSRYPHPRDKRERLPDFVTLQYSSESDV